MKICFEMPTNSRAELEYVKKVAGGSPDMNFILSLNGKEFSKADNFYRDNIAATFSDQFEGKKSVKLNGYRKLAHDTAAKINPDYCIIADANFEFRPTWERSLIKAIKKMKRFEDKSGKRAFLSLRTMFGRPHWTRDVTFCGLQILPTNCGIVYPGDLNLFDSMPIHEGGMGDIYLSTRLIKCFGLVALTKHQVEIFHRSLRKDSALTDRSLWPKGNLGEVRKLWDDRNWCLPPAFGSNEKAVPPLYYAPQPKTADNYVKELRRELLDMGGLHDFIQPHAGE